MIIHNPELAKQIIDSCSKPITQEAKDAIQEKQDSVKVLLEKKIEDMLSMIDGAYEIIELYGNYSENSRQKEWVKNWLEKARKYGASPE